MPQTIICPFCGAENESGRLTCHSCQTNFRQADLLSALTQRLTRLETIVADLQQALPAQAAEPAPEPLPQTAVPQPTPQPKKPTPTPQRAYLPAAVWQSDFWFNKIGLGLLLLALAFLFSYAVEQGWIGPPVRVAIGLIVGTGLLGIGYRTARKRPHFGQALQGGGIAAYYITGFAAFQLYALVALPVAFVYMTLVTLLAFTLSLRQKEAMLSLIGGLGGLVTPILLATGQGSVVGLIIYICFICGSLALIYFFQGWQVVLWLANSGGWAIVLGSMIAFDIFDQAQTSAENWAVQGGILFCLLIYWGLPVVRQLNWQTAFNRLPPIQFGFADSYLPNFVKSVFNTHPQLAILVHPILALWLTLLLWRFPENGDGLLTLGTAVLFGLLAWGISRQQGQDRVWYMHGVTAVFCFTLALALLLDSTWLLLALALEAALLHLGTHFIKRRTLQVGAHIFSLVVVLLLVEHLAEWRIVTPIWNLHSLVVLAVIGLIFATSYLIPSAQNLNFPLLYRLVAHIALLAWFWHEFNVLSGQGLVTIVWGVYAVGLLLLALYFRHQHLRLIALATLFVLVGKLFLVDLVVLETVWRILLFAGFGGLFLFISYFYGSWLGLSEQSRKAP